MDVDWLASATAADTANRNVESTVMTEMRLILLLTSSARRAESIRNAGRHPRLAHAAPSPPRGSLCLAWVICVQWPIDRWPEATTLSAASPPFETTRFATAGTYGWRLMHRPCLACVARQGHLSEFDYRRDCATPSAG